jgi:hypothetical protein
VLTPAQGPHLLTCALHKVGRLAGGGKKRATSRMNFSQLRRAFWLRRLSDTSDVPLLLSARPFVTRSEGHLPRSGSFGVFGHNAPKRPAKVEASNSAVSWLRKPLKNAMRGADVFTQYTRAAEPNRPSSLARSGILCRRPPSAHSAAEAADGEIVLCHRPHRWQPLRHQNTATTTWPGLQDATG